MTIPKNQNGTGAHDCNRRKAFRHRSDQVSTAITNKIKQQFRFIADPNKTLLHNTSTALANTPTWYYFSRPSHLAFHDFTQQKQPAKNLRSLLGLGLKFIPTNTWNKLKETSMPKFQQSIYAFTLQEPRPPLTINTTQKLDPPPPPPPPPHTHTHTLNTHRRRAKRVFRCQIFN